MFIEFNGGNPKTEMLLAVTPTGDTPEIASERSSLTAAIDQLPKVVEKFSAIEDQAKGVLNDVGALASKVKENPSLLLRRPKEKDKESIGAEVRK